MTPKERADKIVKDLGFVAPEFQPEWLTMKITDAIEAAVYEEGEDSDDDE